MLTASAAFALFTMLAIASPIYYIAERVRLPYTVLLTFAGILLVPLSTLETFAFLREFTLTPELLFYIFLPTLIFESAYNMNIRRVVQDSPSIMLLAIVGYLVSAFAIGGALWFIFDLIGLGVPFMVTLLFGALISATDPVAVLALFKEFGAPRRLSTIFEGESLMNDATALALFLIILGLMQFGVSSEALGIGAVTFAVMLVGGTIFGLICGTLVSWVIGFFRHNELVAVSLMLVLAHLTFISSELVNEYFRHHHMAYLQLSPIIATTIASLFMGAYGRFKITPRADEFIEKFWSQFAFMANSVIFILVGFLLTTINVDVSQIIWPVIITILVVAVARALSIYGTLIPYNWFVSEAARVSLPWQHLLAWGSLRGALAVMLVLLVPADLVVAGWGLDMPVRDFLVVITIGCIFATLFIKAPFVGPIMRRLHINTLTPLECSASDRARGIIHGTTVERLNSYVEKAYVPAVIGTELMSDHGTKFTSSCTVSDPRMTERALRIYLLGREKEVLKELLTFDEVTERIYKRINAKLATQIEEAEHGNLNPDPHATYDYRDVFENIAEGLRDIFMPDTLDNAIREEYLYYRAQEILARKVVKEIERLQNGFAEPIFPRPTLQSATLKYSEYLVGAQDKRASLANRFPGIVSSLDQTLAYKSVYRVEESVLDELYHRELLTPKLHATLLEEYREEAHSRTLKAKRPGLSRLTIDS
ncbi:MAG: sodium:proton antiporter [Candidatus Pacebacteria bacterium]|nr:sodium:proton antiporter [Candidatus Paceibacterota bacterium]